VVPIVISATGIIPKSLSQSSSSSKLGTGGKIDSELWYEHVTKSGETSQVDEVIILGNQQVQTNRTIPKNKPDIIIKDNEKGTYMLIDVAIPGDRNVIKKEAEKILKYKDLTTEIRRM
jgi:hypothetical protein